MDNVSNSRIPIFSISYRVEVMLGYTGSLSLETIQSGIENLGSLFWINWIGFRYKISLELRVKTKNPCYPEEMFF